MIIDTDLMDTLLDRLAADEASARPAAPRRVPRTGPLPLSSTQRRLWFVEQLNPMAAAAYRVSFGLRIAGALDRGALRRALDRLVDRHESLRTRFAIDGEEPRLVIDPPGGGFALAEQDLRALPSSARETALAEALEAGLEEPFDLARGPLARGQLVRLGEEEHVLAVQQHHLVTDGWSTRVFLRELGALYAAFRKGGPDPLPPPDLQHVDAAAWQRDALTPAEERAQADFWRERLAGAPERLELPTDRPRPAVPTHAGNAVPVRLPEALARDVGSFGRRHGATPFMVLLAAWSLVLARASGQHDIVVGTPVANRMRPEFEGLIGFFANTLPLRIALDETLSGGALVAHVRDIVLDAVSNQDLPFDGIVEAAQPTRTIAHNPLFQASLTLDNTPGVRGVDLPGLAVEMLDTPCRATPFDLALALSDDGRTIAGRLEYARDLFDRESAERLARQLVAALQGLVAGEAEPVRLIPLMSEAERRAVEAALNPRPAAFPPQGPIQRLFEARAAARPDAIALVCGDESLDYGTLNARANRLAHRLIDAGIRPDDRVALCLDRGIGLVVGMLAILKAGGAYVPLDPDYPAERLSDTLADCAPAAIMLGDGLPLPSQSTAPTIRIDDAGHMPGNAQDDDPGNPDPAVLGLADHHLAYVIYTSGSTGRPKGVMIEHRQVTRLFAATDAWFRFGPEDVWTLFHSAAFDFSVWEIWGALLHGGRLVVVPSLVARSPSDFHALLCREGVTILNQTPTAFRGLVAADAQGGAHRLRVVIFGGEALDLHILEPWIARHDPERTHLVNMYGITETTVHVTYRRIDAADVRAGLGSVIGEPIPDLSFHILDPQGRPVPPGVAGEIHVGGAGVARGYLNRPELTAERFVPDPSGPPGARLYRSGDLARLLPNGEVEYLGRNDSQVKIRGFRIELGEIEARLRACPGLADAVVVAREDVPGDKRLVAYCVPAGSPPEAAELRRRLSAELPAHMVPSAFVPLTAVPLTPNGKLDRRALPAPGREALAGARSAEPQGPVETAVAQAWADLLGVERIGRDDDFFALGGHSILAVRLTAQLSRRLGTPVALRDIFAAPTVRALAQAIEERRAGARHPNLAEIRPAGARAPLFLVHPVEGEVGYARVLAARLDPDIPVYGLSASGLLAGEVPLRSMEAIVETYRAAIRGVRPHGPYRLAGWSAGGSIAHALAARLERDGEQVAFLGLVDTAADYAGIAPPQPRDLAATGADRATAERYRAVSEGILAAVRAYTPTPLAAHIHLFTAAAETRADPALGWNAVQGDGLTVTPIAATHYGIVEPPAVDRLSAALEAALEEA